MKSKINMMEFKCKELAKWSLTLRGTVTKLERWHVHELPGVAQCGKKFHIGSTEPPLHFVHPIMKTAILQKSDFSKWSCPSCTFSSIISITKVVFIPWILRQTLESVLWREEGVRLYAQCWTEDLDLFSCSYLRADPAAGDGRAFTAAKTGGKDPGTLPSSVEAYLGSFTERYFWVGRRQFIVNFIMELQEVCYVGFSQFISWATQGSCILW